MLFIFLIMIGLGNIVSAGVEDVNKYATTILDALLTSIDDQNETLAMEVLPKQTKTRIIILFIYFIYFYFYFIYLFFILFYFIFNLI